MRKSVQHLQNIDVQDEYGTPNVELRKAMMNYDVLPFLDVCTNDANAKFQNYFTKEDDALTKEWNCDFFMNPPYSRVTEFIEYAFKQHRKHNVTALILTYSKTDTKWWHDYVEQYAEIHFIKGRVQFNDKDGKPVLNKNPESKSFGKRQSAPYPSCWIIFRRTDLKCEACDTNPLFYNQIVCDFCNENTKPEDLCFD